MNILINDHRKIYAIQEAFNNTFPYLKLEFLSKPHTSSGAASHKLVKHNSKTLGECRTIHNKGKISISPSMSVADLEQKFSDVYGLTIQVYRKSGTSWLETSLTDGWSLEEQNSQGEILSKMVS